MLTSAYIHFPWCLKKCPYCDFASASTRRDQVAHAAYADAVLRELEPHALGDRTLFSVFFGGGTPSLWDPAELGRVLAGVRAAFGAEREDLEITIECNPTSLDADKARALAAVGVNRLSVGVQSLDARHLRHLGRLHDAEGALRALRAAREGVARVSGDLMFGMPEQTPAEFTAEIEGVLACGVEHVSAYALTIEPDTQFGALHKKGKLPLATEDAYADTFVAARERFAAAGLGQYEVSNYALPGAESRHNQHYWRGGDYLGIGAGAVGTLSDGPSARRTKNEAHPERYMQGAPPAFVEELSPEDRVREALMLGLRTAEGVDLAAVQERTGLDLREGRERALERRHASGDVTLDGRMLRVPQERWLGLDSVVADLF